MANTKTSTKRSHQAIRRQARNQSIRSATRTAIRHAMESIKATDPVKGKLALQIAIKSLGKAASKGALPKKRAARKMSRLTLLAKKSLPAVFNQAS